MVAATSAPVSHGVARGEDGAEHGEQQEHRLVRHGGDRDGHHERKDDGEPGEALAGRGLGRSGPAYDDRLARGDPTGRTPDLERAVPGRPRRGGSGPWLSDDERAAAGTDPLARMQRGSRRRDSRPLDLGAVRGTEIADPQASRGHGEHRVVPRDRRVADAHSRGGGSPDDVLTGPHGIPPPRVGAADHVDHQNSRVGERAGAVPGVASAVGEDAAVHQRWESPPGVRLNLPAADVQPFVGRQTRDLLELAPDVAQGAAHGPGHLDVHDVCPVRGDDAAPEADHGPSVREGGDSWAGHPQPLP
jgi:hypothetical protein